MKPHSPMHYTFLRAKYTIQYNTILCILKRHPVVVCALFIFVKYVKLIYSNVDAGVVTFPKWCHTRGPGILSSYL